MSNQQSVEVQTWRSGELEIRLNRVEKALRSKSRRSWATIIIVILLAAWAGHSARRPSSPLIFDKHGIPRIGFHANSDAELFGLQIQSAEQKNRAMLLSHTGFITLYLYDQNEVSRAALGVDPSGAPVLIFSDRNGKCRLQIQEDESDLPSLMLFDNAEKCRLSIELAVSGIPSIRFFDADEQAQIGVTMSPNGTPVLEILNSTSGKLEQFEWDIEKVGLTKSESGQ